MESQLREDLVLRAEPYKKVVQTAYQRLTANSEHEFWQGTKGKMYKYDITFQDGTVAVYNSEHSYVNPPAFPVNKEVCFKVTHLNSKEVKIMPCQETPPQPIQHPGAPPPQKPPTTYHPFDDQSSNAIGSIALSPGYLSLKLAIELGAGKDWSAAKAIDVASTFKAYIFDNLK